MRQKLSCELMVKGVNMEEKWLKDQVGFKDNRRRLPVLAYRAPDTAAQSEFTE